MSASNAAFTVRTAAFWLDADGVNRWTFTPSEGNPVEVHGSCDACGHAIMTAFLILHPQRGGRGVGCECIYRIATTLSWVDRAKVELAIKRAKAAKVQLRRNTLATSLETASAVPEIRVALWLYNDRQQGLAGSLQWYAGQLRAGHSYAHFQASLKAELVRRGYDSVFSRASVPSAPVAQEVTA